MKEIPLFYYYILCRIRIGPKRVCDKKVGILKTPLWKRGARGDFLKDISP